MHVTWYKEFSIPNSRKIGVSYCRSEIIDNTFNFSRIIKILNKKFIFLETINRPYSIMKHSQYMYI